MRISSPYIDASTQSSILGSPLPFSFLDKSSLSTSSLGCNAVCIVINFLVLWYICLRISLVHFKNCLDYLKRETAHLFIPLTRFLQVFGFKKCSRSPEILFSYFFFHFRLFDCIHFQYSQVLVIFLFSQSFDSFFIWKFYSFRCTSFPTFHYKNITFFNVQFHSYILVVYSYHLYQAFHFFFIFCKQHDVSFLVLL